MAIRGVMVGVGNTALENSARLFCDEAEHFAPGIDATLLQGDSATKDAVLGAIQDFAKATERSDILVVSFSAHAATGMGEHREWVSLADTAISDLELNNAISYVQPGSRVVLVADACKILGVGDDNAISVHHVLLRRWPGAAPRLHTLLEPISVSIPASERDLAEPSDAGLVQVPLHDLDYMVLELPASSQSGTTSSDATCTIRGSAETVTCSAYMSALVRVLRQGAPPPTYLDAHEQVRRQMGSNVPHARLYVPSGFLRDGPGTEGDDGPPPDKPTFVDTPFFSEPPFDAPLLTPPVIMSRPENPDA